MLKLVDITKVYKEGKRNHQVLDKVNLTVESGEKIAILGKSGSGKSTLLNIISGVDTVTEGKVFYGDTELSSLDQQARTLFRRKYVGFIFQFFNLIPTLTIEENLLLPLQLNNLDKKFTANHIAQLLSTLEMEDRASSFPDRLSGGEKQRIAIARSLVHNPDLILADEPTGNLDYDTGEKVISVLNRMVSEKGKTLIIATHSRRLAVIADRVLRIDRGQLHEYYPEDLN